MATLSAPMWVLITIAVIVFLIVADRLICSGPLSRARKKRAKIEAAKLEEARQAALVGEPYHMIAIAPDDTTEPMTRAHHPQEVRYAEPGIMEVQGTRKAGIGWAQPMNPKY